VGSSSLDSDSAFVGLGISLDRKAARGNQVILGCSHLYNAQGQRLQFRLSKIKNPVFRNKNAFMSYDDARRVGETIRQQFWESRFRFPDRLTTTTYPTQPVTTTTRTYDFRNNVVNETDQGGHVTHHVYDLAGRLTSLTRAFGTSNASTTTYTYDADGRKESETDPLGHTATYTYDAAGNLTAVSGVKGSFKYGYDNARNRISVTDGTQVAARGKCSHSSAVGFLRPSSP
jgi:YD repeat-containing protein